MVGTGVAGEEELGLGDEGGELGEGEAPGEIEGALAEGCSDGSGEVHFGLEAGDDGTPGAGVENALGEVDPAGGWPAFGGA